jgi:hypothetical protein
MKYTLPYCFVGKESDFLYKQLLMFTLRINKYEDKLLLYSLKDRLTTEMVFLLWLVISDVMAR